MGCSWKGGGLNVVHGFASLALFEELLEGEVVCCGIDGGLEGLPELDDFGEGLVDVGRLEKGALDGSDDLADGDFAGSFLKLIATFFASLAADESVGFEFNQDLGQVLGRDFLSGRQRFDALRFSGGMALSQTQERTHGVFTFNGNLHG